MRAAPFHLAFDLGATSWRAILGRRTDEAFAIEEIHRERHAPREVDGGLFWDFEGILAGITGVLREIARRGIVLASIGIDSWSVDYGLLDARGDLLEPPRCYRDPRTEGMTAKLEARLGIRRLFERTWLLAEDITTLCQLMAASEATPLLLSKAHRLLFIPDLLRAHLCGVEATDFTLATTSQLYDPRADRWDPELAAVGGIDAGILPSVRHGHSVLGTLTPAMQAATGLGPVPVTIGASHDNAAAFMTQPMDDDSAILSSGTWSMLGVHLPAPVFPPGIDSSRFGHEGNPDGSVRLLCNIPGMWILEQCRASWARAGKETSYEALVQGAAASDGSTGAIDPYDPAFGLSPDMSRSVIEHCAKTGQRVPGTQFEIARAIFQGLATCYARAREELESFSGRRFKRIRVIGGGVRNELLNSLIERKTGIEVVRGPAEATAIGNMMSQEKALAAS